MELPSEPTILLFFLLVDLDLFSVFQDIGVDRLINKLASPASNLQDEIVQGGAPKNIHMIRYFTLAHPSDFKVLQTHQYSVHL